MDNMEIYNRVRSVPDNAQKRFNNGRFSGTDIKPMWRIKALTEVFGPCGIGWYIDDVRHWNETFQNGTIATFVELNLYVKLDGEWSRPIYGMGGNSSATMTNNNKYVVDDEGYKKAYTDAISVACKALGVGADIYYSEDAVDKSSKYAQYYEDSGNAPAPAKTKAQAPDNAPAPAKTKAQAPDNPRKGLITNDQLITIQTNCNADEIGKLCEKYKVANIANLTSVQGAVVCRQLEKRREQRATV